MGISLDNYLRNKLDEVESMHSYELATDTLRCWIDDYNEQLRQYNVVGRSKQLCDYVGECKSIDETIDGCRWLGSKK